MLPMNGISPLIGYSYSLREGSNLGGYVTHDLPPCPVVVDVRINVFPPFESIVHQHRP